MKWLVAIFLIAVVASVGAFAAPSGDPSPDPSYRGLWYVIGAAPAPWSSQQALKTGQAPLLSYLLSFDDGAVTGAPPLACAPALYHFDFATAATMFQGRLDAAKSEVLAKAMGFAANHVETQVVTCGGATFAYYLTDNRADLLIAIGDVIYRLRRPDGSASDLKPGFAGPSFDCIAPSSAAQRIICGDVNLAGFDRAIGEALTHLKTSETPDSFATVNAAQQGWHDYTVQRCKAGGAIPANADAVRTMHECLSDAYQDQSPVMAALAVLHAGPNTLEPRARFATRLEPSRFEMDLYPWLSGTIGAPFNAYVERLLGLDQWAIDDKTYFVVSDPPSDQSAWARRSYTSARVDGRVISLTVFATSFSGFGHEVVDELDINWDVAKNAPIGFADLFRAGQDWQKFVTDFCVTDLTHQFDQGTDPPARDAVARVVATPAAWLFFPDKAELRFGPGIVANEMAGEYDVDIPYAALKAYLLPNASVLAPQ